MILCNRMKRFTNILIKTCIRSVIVEYKLQNLFGMSITFKLLYIFYWIIINTVEGAVFCKCVSLSLVRYSTQISNNCNVLIIFRVVHLNCQNCFYFKLYTQQLIKTIWKYLYRQRCVRVVHGT